VYAEATAMSHLKEENGIMKRLCLIASICCVLGAWTLPAAAVVIIDFENLPTEPFDLYEEAGVVFTAVDGSLLQKFADTPNGTFSLTGLTAPYPELRADIEGGASFVSVDLGDFAGIDAETVFLQVFGAAGNPLGSDSENIPANRLGMTTLSVEAPGISYAIFGSRNSTLGNGSSVPADYFTFTPAIPAASIPAPGAILLGMIGTGLVGCLRRRRML
jgi:hypothetical protein